MGRRERERKRGGTRNAGIDSRRGGSKQAPLSRLDSTLVESVDSFQSERVSKMTRSILFLLTLTQHSEQHFFSLLLLLLLPEACERYIPIRDDAFSLLTNPSIVDANCTIEKNDLS